MGVFNMRPCTIDEDKLIAAMTKKLRDFLKHSRDCEFQPSAFELNARFHSRERMLNHNIGVYRPVNFRKKVSARV